MLTWVPQQPIADALATLNDVSAEVLRPDGGGHPGLGPDTGEFRPGPVERFVAGQPLANVITGEY